MSAVPPADAASKSASKKKRKNKKKAADKNKSTNDSADANGAQDEAEDDADDVDANNDDSASRSQSIANASGEPAPLAVNGTEQTDDSLSSRPSSATNDTSARLDAIAKERDSLRDELQELRKSLDTMREKHLQETEELKSQAEQDKSAKDNAEILDLRKSLDTIKEKHQQELDNLNKQAEDAQSTKDNAEITELRKSIQDLQDKHRQDLESIQEQARQTQTTKDNAEVAELRKSIESLQEKHALEIDGLKSHAQESQQGKDNEEIAQLRKSLESAKEDHQREVDALKKQVQEAQSGKSDSDAGAQQTEELESLKTQLQEAESAKENAETQYRSLLGKVNTIRSQLGERLKADAEELSKARAEIEELQQENKSTRETQEELQATIETLQSEHKDKDSEIESLRSRTNLSQSNWVKERDELVSKEAYAREEFENARQAMQDWEVLAMEERSLRENLNDRVVELEEQLNAQRESYDRAASERDIQNSTVDSLQRALQDIQDARKKELREMVESSQAQLDALRAQAEEAKSAAATSAIELETTQKELERALPFEKEVKEKNLLIGKLRHEAVILNDHLTKALRFLKRGKPEDNVDRHIVTNHFLHFLTLDRSDPKKFQVLQLIAALLGWTEEQREQAGLARPGASNSMLRVPLSPFRRTPSTPSLSDSTFDNHAGGSKESLAELWSDFLEREAQEGGGHGISRSGSLAGMLSPTSEKGSDAFGIKSPRP